MSLHLTNSDLNYLSAIEKNERQSTPHSSSHRSRQRLKAHNLIYFCPNDRKYKLTEPGKKLAGILEKISGSFAPLIYPTVFNETMQSGIKAVSAVSVQIHAFGMNVAAIIIAVLAVYVILRLKLYYETEGKKEWSLTQLSPHKFKLEKTIYEGNLHAAKNRNYIINTPPDELNGIPLHCFNLEYPISLSLAKPKNSDDVKVDSLTLKAAMESEIAKQLYSVKPESGDVMMHIILGAVAGAGLMAIMFATKMIKI